MTKEEINDRLNRNLDRVENLVTIYETHLAGHGQGRRPVNSTDVLRSAAVLLHASLEDFLRNIAARRLPAAAENVVDKIPLAGIDAEGRPEKFLLGKLVVHRGKSVDDVIRESVDAYLERSNYNNVQELTRLIQGVGLDVVPCRIHFADLTQMMDRRHWIVHRADLNEQHGQGQHHARGINKDTVRGWATTVRAFANALLQQIP